LPETVGGVRSRAENAVEEDSKRENIATSLQSGEIAVSRAAGQVAGGEDGATSVRRYTVGKRRQYKRAGKKVVDETAERNAETADQRALEDGDHQLKNEIEQEPAKVMKDIDDYDDLGI